MIRRIFLKSAGFGAADAVMRAMPVSAPSSSSEKAVPSTGTRAELGIRGIGLSIEEIIAKRGYHRLPHEARIADPMHRSYSWGRHATEDTPAIEGPRSVNAWIVAFRSDAEQRSTPEARVNVRRLALWAFTAGRWLKGDDGMPTWTVSSNPDTSGDYRRLQPKIESDGSRSFEFPVQRALHFSARAPGLQVEDTQAILTVVEARLLGPAAPDWVIGSGADFRNPGGDNHSIRQSGFGHLGRLTSHWRSYPMLSSSLSDAEIRASGPPL